MLAQLLVVISLSCVVLCLQWKFSFYGQRNANLFLSISVYLSFLSFELNSTRCADVYQHCNVFNSFKYVCLFSIILFAQKWKKKAIDRNQNKKCIYFRCKKLIVRNRAECIRRVLCSLCTYCTISTRTISHCVRWAITERRVKHTQRIDLTAIYKKICLNKKKKKRK